MCFDCFGVHPEDCNLASILVSESPTMSRSFASATASSKSAFSSAANKSSQDWPAFLRREVFPSPFTLRVLRVTRFSGSLGVVVGSGALATVLRVRRTGLLDSVAVADVVVFRLLRTGAEAPALSGVERDGRVGLASWRVPGGPRVLDAPKSVVGGPLDAGPALVGGPRLAGPLCGVSRCIGDGAGVEARAGMVGVLSNGLQSSSSSPC